MSSDLSDLESSLADLRKPLLKHYHQKQTRTEVQGHATKTTCTTTSETPPSKSPLKKRAKTTSSANAMPKHLFQDDMDFSPEEPQSDSEDGGDRSTINEDDKDELSDSDRPSNHRFRGQWPTFPKTNSSECWNPKDVLDILLNAQTLGSQTCSSVPQQCGEAESFVIDLECLEDPADITGDDNGAYSRPTTKKSKVEVDNDVYYVKRRY